MQSVAISRECCSPYMDMYRIDLLSSAPILGAFLFGKLIDKLTAYRNFFAIHLCHLQGVVNQNINDSLLALAMPISEFSFRYLSVRPLRIIKVKIMTRKLFPKTTTIIAIALATFTASAFADDDGHDSHGSSYHDSPRANNGGPRAHRQGGRVNHGLRKIVKDYIAEKKISGEIDSYEFDVREEQLALIREEMKAAREINDRLTIQAKREALRTLRAEERNATRELVTNNPELQQRIKDYHLARQERRKVRREDRQEFLEFQEQKRQDRIDQRDAEQVQ